MEFLSDFNVSAKHLTNLVPDLLIWTSPWNEMLSIWPPWKESSCHSPRSTALVAEAILSRLIPLGPCSQTKLPSPSFHWTRLLRFLLQRHLLLLLRSLCASPRDLARRVCCGCGFLCCLFSLALSLVERRLQLCNLQQPTVSVGASERIDLESQPPVE